MYKKPMAKMSEGTELPNTTMKVAASAMPGKDMMMSRMRMMTLAMRGRTTAAMAPMMEPTTSAKPVAPRPMTKEYLAPHIRRDITSRPLSSVPNRCAESGAQNEVKIS